MKKWVPYLGAIVFFFSLGLRLIGIGWGLPNDLHNDSYHPDEPINLAVSRLIEPAHLNFVPGWYNYGTFFLTLSNLASGYVAAPEDNSPKSNADYDRACLLAGRIVSALAGAGTAWILWALLKKRTHWLGAFGGALAVGLAPAFVVHSRFDTVDVTATFLIAVSLFFALKLLPDKDGNGPPHYMRYVALSGGFAGLSAGTKYLGAIVILALFAAIFLARRPDWPRLLAIAAGSAFIAFVVSTPGVILDWQRFKDGFSYETGHAATGHGLVFVDTGPAAMYHIVSLAVGLGALTFILGAAALIYAGVKKKQWAFVLLAMAIPYFLVISASHVEFLRYTFPLYVPICIAFGWVVGQAHINRKNVVWVVIVAIIALGFEVRTDKQYAEWMAGEDPRDQAARAIKEVVTQRPNTVVGVTADPWYYTPPLYLDSAMPRPRWMREGLQKMQEATTPHVVYFTPDQKPDYVTFSSLQSWDLDRLQGAKDLTGPDQALVDQWKATSERLKNEYQNPVRFGGAEPPRFYREDLEYVHPYVYVWKRKDLP